MNGALATLVLCVSHLDGAIGLSTSQVEAEGAVSYVWEPGQLSRLSTLERVKVVRTRRFPGSRHAAAIEAALASLGREDVQFVVVNGVLYPTTGVRLTAERGEDGEWKIAAEIALAFGLTVGATATSAAAGRCLALHGAEVVSAEP